jgi:hypothetical protein
LFEDSVVRGEKEKYMGDTCPGQQGVEGTFRRGYITRKNHSCSYSLPRSKPQPRKKKVLAIAFISFKIILSSGPYVFSSETATFFKAEQQFL